MLLWSFRIFFNFESSGFNFWVKYYFENFRWVLTILSSFTQLRGRHSKDITELLCPTFLRITGSSSYPYEWRSWGHQDEGIVGIQIGGHSINLVQVKISNYCEKILKLTPIVNIRCWPPPLVCTLWSLSALGTAESRLVQSDHLPWRCHPCAPPWAALRKDSWGEQVPYPEPPAPEKYTASMH